jgi:hypothetical protein
MTPNELPWPWDLGYGLLLTILVLGGLLAYGYAVFDWR